MIFGGVKMVEELLIWFLFGWLTGDALMRKNIIPFLCVSLYLIIRLSKNILLLL